MRTTQHLVSLFLIVTFLASSFPIFCPEDANRDEGIDLRDAILHLRSLEQSTENPATFKSGFEKTLSTFRMLAGMKTVIKQANTPKSGHLPLLLDSPFLTASSEVPIPLEFGQKIVEPILLYQSIFICPPYPPPQV